MASNSVACHVIQVNMPCLNPIWACQCSLPTPEGYKVELTWIVDVLFLFCSASVHRSVVLLLWLAGMVICWNDSSAVAAVLWWHHFRHCRHNPSAKYTIRSQSVCLTVTLLQSEASSCAVSD